MPYVVTIDRVGRNGLPEGQPIMRCVASEAEALTVMQGAAQDAIKARQQMLFSLYDHGKRLLISYTSEDASLVPLGAFAP